jgi:thiol-disulfide isomerase/thioredoxin
MRVLLGGLAAGLLAIGLRAWAADDDDAMSKVRELAQEYLKSSTKQRAMLQAAESDEERTKLKAEIAKSYVEFADKMLAIVKDNPKGQAGIQAAGVVVMAARGTPDSAKVLDSVAEAMTKHLLENEQVGQLCLALARHAATPAIEKCFRDVSELSSSTAAQGQALYSLGMALIHKAEKAYQKDRKGHEEINAEAEQVFEKVIEKYADVSFAPNRKLGAVAKQEIETLRKLSVGKEAPEIEGKDLAGESMKLSDFRGKVVVLDFWTTWCGPCVASFPHIKEMIERNKDKPFQFVGVNADTQKDADQVAEFLKEKECKWRNFFSKGTSVVKDYQIQFFPSIYVLDHKGVIRYKHVRGEELDAAVNQLLDELAREKEKSASN